MPKWNTVKKGDEPAARNEVSQKQQAFHFQPQGRPSKIEVVVRHWMHGTEMRVLLPKRAKFKHLRKAIANCLGIEEDLGPGLKLMQSHDGIYTTFKDRQAIGECRLILARCADELWSEGAEVTLSEGEVSEEEILHHAIVPVTEEILHHAIVPVTESKILPANTAAARRVRAGGPLTRKYGISLLLELLEAFKDSSFQQPLADLEARKQAGGMSNLDFQKGFRTLKLSVQERILPKYGFEGTEDGVLRMVVSMQPFFQKDSEFFPPFHEINEILGTPQSVERWLQVCVECRRLAQRERGARPRARPLPGLPTGTRSIAIEGFLSMPSVQTFAGGMAPHGMGMATIDLKYEPWPPGQGKPFNLYVIGSWNDNVPMPMHWESGVFTCSITMGADGMEIFQLLQGRDWSKTYYPSVQDATPREEHKVLGPDEGSEGRSWLIGSADGTLGRAGDQFLIVAAIDSQARVVHVDWRMDF